MARSHTSGRTTSQGADHDTVEELRQALLAFRETYNATWLIERHGFRPPSAIRADQLPPAAIAA